MSESLILEEDKEKIYMSIPIDVSFNNMNVNEMFFYKIIKDMQKKIIKLNEKIEYFEKNQNDSIVYKFDEISDDLAKTMIKDYLHRMKNKVKHISIFELSQNLKISTEQVEDVIEKLSKTENIKFL